MVQRNQQGLKKKQSYIKAPANLCDDRMNYRHCAIYRIIELYTEWMIYRHCIVSGTRVD